MKKKKKQEENNKTKQTEQEKKEETKVKRKTKLIIYLLTQSIHRSNNEMKITTLIRMTTTQSHTVCIYLIN